MRWAEVGSGTVSRVTVSHDDAFGAEWLAENVGGTWVAVPNGVVCGPGVFYIDGEFVVPVMEVEEPSAK